MKYRYYAALLLTAAAALGQNTDSAHAGAKLESLPSAEQVMNHYIEATGGAKAHAAVTSEIATGTFSMPAAGITGAMTVYQKAPNKMYSVVDIPNVGKIEDGTDGKTAWELSAVQGPRIKKGDEAAAALRQSALDLATDWKKYYKSAEVLGTDTVDGKVCYKVLMTPQTGSPETQYFEKDSGLLVKLSTIADTPMGKVPTEILYGDYRKEGDMMVPYKNEIQVANQTLVTTIEKVTVNPDIPENRFDLPAEIKALQAK